MSNPLEEIDQELVKHSEQTLHLVQELAECSQNSCDLTARYIQTLIKEFPELLSAKVSAGSVKVYRQGGSEVYLRDVSLPQEDPNYLPTKFWSYYLRVTQWYSRMATLVPVCKGYRHVTAGRIASFDSLAEEDSHGRDDQEPRSGSDQQTG